MVRVKNIMPLFWVCRKFNMLFSLVRNKFAPSMQKFWFIGLQKTKDQRASVLGLHLLPLLADPM